MDTSTVKKIRYYVIVLIAVITCAVLLYLYGRHSFKINPAFELLQVPIDSWTADLLAERNPILITEPLVDPLPTLRLMLRYHFVMSSQSAPSMITLKRNAHKFLGVVAAYDGQEITIAHPRSPETEVLTLKLARDQVLLLPYGWSLLHVDDEVVLLRFDDVFTRLFLQRSR